MKLRLKVLILAGCALGACLKSSNAGIELFDIKDTQGQGKYSSKIFSRIENATEQPIKVSLAYAVGGGNTVQGNLDTGSQDDIEIPSRKTAIFTPNEGPAESYSIIKITERISGTQYEADASHIDCQVNPLRHVTFTKDFPNKPIHRFTNWIRIHLKK